MKFDYEPRLVTVAARPQHNEPSARMAAANSEPLNDRSWPVGEQMRRQPAESIKSLNLGLLGDLQRIVNLNSEVAHRAFQLGVAEQQLHYPEILCSSVDQ